MPMTALLSAPWYDTPNIHLCTIRDFVALCDEDGIGIERSVTLDRHGRPFSLDPAGTLANLLAAQAIFPAARRQPKRFSARPGSARRAAGYRPARAHAARLRGRGLGIDLLRRLDHRDAGEAVNQRSPIVSHAPAERSIMRDRVGGTNSADAVRSGVKPASRRRRESWPGV